MNYRIAITAGTGFKADGKRLQPGEISMGVKYARRKLAEAFGGYTESLTNGGWINGAGELVEEAGRRWVSLTESANVDALGRKVGEIAKLIGETLGQESVVIEVEPVPVMTFVACCNPVADAIPLAEVA